MKIIILSRLINSQLCIKFVPVAPELRGDTIDNSGNQTLQIILNYICIDPSAFANETVFYFRTVLNKYAKTRVSPNGSMPTRIRDGRGVSK